MTTNPIPASTADDLPHGELDPRTAYETARSMLSYVQAFNGQEWSLSTLGGNVDRKNLGVALDNLQECAAMLLNQSDRLRAELAARDAVPAESLASWPIHGIRVDRGTVVIVAKGNTAAADDAARWMCGELLAMKGGSLQAAKPGDEPSKVAASEPVANAERQIAAALRQHGLTLMKTAAGYEAVKLGELTSGG